MKISKAQTMVLRFAASNAHDWWQFNREIGTDMADCPPVPRRATYNALASRGLIVAGDDGRYDATPAGREIIAEHIWPKACKRCGHVHATPAHAKSNGRKHFCTWCGDTAPAL